MSDILIKGMEMPKSCMLCPFCVEEADPENGEMCMVTGKLMPPCTRVRLDDCPLVPVPPHGDLIDRDALPTIRVEWEDIVNAPAVIPAELPVHHGTFAATSEKEDLERIIPAEEGE